MILIHTYGSSTNININTGSTTASFRQDAGEIQVQGFVPCCRLFIKRLRAVSTAQTYYFALDYFNGYLVQKNYNIQTVIDALIQKKLDIYKLLNGYVSYLKDETKNGHDMSGKTVKIYVAAVKSYLQYNDIDISPVKFKYQITMPPIYTEGEEPIDANDIREMLNRCTNRRLKAYILVLASSGMRAVEALAIRLRDIDFDSGSPTETRIRKEYTKTMQPCQVTIAEDELYNIDKDNDKRSMYLSGYEHDGNATRTVDAGKPTRHSVDYPTFGYKICCGERPPTDEKMSGFNDRTFYINSHKGIPEFYVKKLQLKHMPTNYRKLLSEINEFHKLILIYRMLHYNGVSNYANKY
jgi:hypothetical protein